MSQLEGQRVRQRNLITVPLCLIRGPRDLGLLDESEHPQEGSEGRPQGSDGLPVGSGGQPEGSGGQREESQDRGSVGWPEGSHSQ